VAFRDPLPYPEVPQWVTDLAFGATLARIGCLDGVQPGRRFSGAQVINDATSLGSTAHAFRH
jgi:hypothetical protein